MGILKVYDAMVDTAYRDHLKIKIKKEWKKQEIQKSDIVSMNWYGVRYVVCIKMITIDKSK